MKPLAFCLMTFLAAVPSIGAVTDPAELQKALQDALQGKVLMLRGFPVDQKITYDASLRPISQLHPDSWTLSNLEVDIVTVSTNQIEISGKHVSYEYNEKTKQFVQVREKQDVHLRIEGELQGAAGQIVDRLRSQVFLGDQREVYASLPDLWKEYFAYAAEQLKKSKEEPKLVLRPKPSSLEPPPADWSKLKPPRVTYSPHPSPPPHHGLVNVGTLVEMIIDTDGKTRNIRLRSPLGMGYDERAMEAVKKWRFKPATKDGKPLTTTMSTVVFFKPQ